MESPLPNNILRDGALLGPQGRGTGAPSEKKLSIGPPWSFRSVSGPGLLLAPISCFVRFPCAVFSVFSLFLTAFDLPTCVSRPFRTLFFRFLAAFGLPICVSRPLRALFFRLARFPCVVHANPVNFETVSFSTTSPERAAKPRNSRGFRAFRHLSP